MSRAHYPRHGMRRALRHTFSRLGTSPGQEKVIRDALLRVRNSAKDVATDLRNARPELSDVLIQNDFDEERVEQWITDREHAFSNIKPEVMKSLREIHGVLDEEQRRKLGRWALSGPERLFPFGGHNGRWGHVC